MNEFWVFDDILADKPALLIPGQKTLTYAALDALVEQWKEMLLGMAAGRRPMVALEFQTSAAAIAAYLGALRAGLPLLVVEPGQIGVTSRLQQHWCPEICIVEQDGVLRALENAPLGLTYDAHPDLRLLLSTSGSTGDPKLVRLSGRNINSNAHSIAEYLTITSADRAMTTLPLFYSYGLSVLNSYLAVGASLVLTERSVTEQAFWDEFRQHDATSLALVPHQFDLLEGSGFSALRLLKLRYITQAGGKLSPDTVRRFHALALADGWNLVLMYGQTEAAPRISYVPPSSLPNAADTIGRAIPGGRLWLADDAGAEITKPGVPGELVYEGPNVMMGYAETRDDLVRGAEVTELRTGDIAERTDDGLFRIVGRLKRFVKLFGLRLSLDQIEALLDGKGVPAHAAAVDDRLVILHQKADQGEIARDIISEEYGLPRSSIYAGHLPEIPLLASGKSDQKTLRQLAEDVLAAAEASEVEGESIADALMAATRSHSVRPEDSFTSLGGDSLSYLQMQLTLERRLGHAPEGWENMSLARLEALMPAALPQGRLSPVGIDVLLRLVAISLVVAQHASDYPLYGGTWMLIAVMGFSAARFQLRLIAEGRALRFGSRMLYPILPLYFLLLLVYGLLRDEVPVSSILLYGNYHLWTKGTLLTVYWFVSLYVQIVLILMLVASIPPTRRMIARTPWGTAAIVLPLLMLIDAFLPAIIGKDAGLKSMPYHPTHGLLECLPIFVLGWMLQRMGGRMQTIVTLVFAVVVLGQFFLISGNLDPTIFLTATILLLAIDPKIKLPTALTRSLQQLASVTLFVYLLHEVAVFFVQQLQLPDILAVLISIPLSFAMAIMSKAAFDLLDQRFLEFTAARLGQGQAFGPSVR